MGQAAGARVENTPHNPCLANAGGFTSKLSLANPLNVSHGGFFIFSAAGYFVNFSASFSACPPGPKLFLNKLFV